MAQNIKLRFAQRLRELRDEHNLTQQRLSELSKIDYKHIQRLESKNPPAARIDTLEKIAKAFDIPIHELVTFE
jgi:putative transcriptional regulator